MSLSIHGAVLGIGMWGWHQLQLPKVSVSVGTGDAGGNGEMLITESTAEAAGIERPAMPAVFVPAQEIEASPIPADGLIGGPDIFWGPQVMALPESSSNGAIGAPGEPMLGAFSESFQPSAPPMPRQSVGTGSGKQVGDGQGDGDGFAGGAPSPSSRNKPPVYPIEARRRGLEGTVMLRVEVLEDGTVGNVSIITSTGHQLLDQAAVEAVKKWHFDPARMNGQPQRCEVQLPVRFVLKN